MTETTEATEAETTEQAEPTTRKRAKARLTPTQLDALLTSVKGLQKRVVKTQLRIEEIAQQYPDESFVGKKLYAAAAELHGSSEQNVQVAIEELEEINARMNEFFA
jgi:hypothetical protein